MIGLPVSGSRPPFSGFRAANGARLIALASKSAKFVPSALPFIFAALKVSATASIVGVVIGELPSSIQDGLGGQILNYSQYYSTQPTGLWATNVIAAALGISFFIVILAAEKIVVRRAPENVA